MNSRHPESVRLQYLDALGIDVWRRRDLAPVVDELAAEAVDEPPAAAASLPAVAPAAREAPPSANIDAGEVAALDWAALATRVSGCTLCGLHASRTQTVFGVGNRQADLLIIGEAPGAEEDRRGEPFVGRAGKLLDEMLRAIGLDRNTAFIANVLKCRPPGNRDPKPEEAASCRPYLDRQVALIAPRVILAVGRIAAQQLLGTDSPLGRLRGRAHRLEPQGIPVVVTYHPAYLLRTPAQKRKAWEDLCTARRMLEGSA